MAPHPAADAARLAGKIAIIPAHFFSFPVDTAWFVSIIHLAGRVTVQSELYLRKMIHAYLGNDY